MLIKRIIGFVLAIGLQYVFFDKMLMSGYVHPFPYILFILLLPFEVPGYVLLSSAFLLGLGVDIFSNSLGVHATACVLIAGLRPMLVRSLVKRMPHDNKIKPNISSLGFSKYLFYAGVLTLIHHLCVFSLEILNWGDWADIIRRSVFSGIFTMIWILIFQYLFTSRKQKRTQRI